MASRADEQMISEKVAPVLVARTLGPFDLVVIFVAIVLFINNAAGVQFAGPSVFIFWILAFATFLVTGAFVTAQLGRMFPEEGSLYVWTHKVLGPFWGFFAGFVAWWPGPISLVFIGILFANFLQQAAVFIDPDCAAPCLFTKNWQIGVVVLLVIWFSALMSYLKMRVTQNYVNVLFWFYAAVIFLIGFAGVWWLLQGNGSSTDFGNGATWNPLQGDELALGLPANLTFFSFAILALLGIETPLNMGAEVTGGEKAIRTFLLWGCAIVMVAYLWATWGNMVVIEFGGANGTTGGVETIGLSLGRWFGAAAGLVMAWVVLTVAVVYNFSFGRLLFVSGMEKRLPHQIGKVNRNKVPANAITLQSVISTILAILVFFVLGGGESRSLQVLLHPLRGGHDRVVHLDGAAVPRHLLREARRARAVRARAARPGRLVVPVRRRWVRGQHPRGALHLRGLVVSGRVPDARRVELVDVRFHGRLGDLGDRDLVRVAVRETRQDGRAAHR